MRKIAEIRKELNDAYEVLKAVDKADKKACDDAVAKVEALMRELEVAEAAENAARALAEDKFRGEEKKSNRKFSLIRFLNGCINKNLSGLELKAAEAGAEEYRRLGFDPQGTVIPSFVVRDILGQSAKDDGDALGETMSPIFMPRLRDKLTVQGLGARVLRGLVGKLPVVSGSAITAVWAEEGESVAIQKVNWAKRMLSPKRNVTVVAFTQDLLRQTSYDVVADLRREMENAHDELLESGAINGALKGPTGIVNTEGVSKIAVDGPISWDKIVDAETAINVSNANKGSLAYLTDSKVWGALKKTPKVEGGERMIIDDPNSRMLNGYTIDYTNAIDTDEQGAHTIVFGNWNDLVIGEWGGLDIVVDPYTESTSAQVIITVNSWNDAIVAEPKSFAVLTGITTD